MVWSSGDSLNSTNLNTKGFGPTYNIKTYGAVGDGTTDDAASVLSAIFAAQLAGGGLVFAPPGTYSYSTTITVPRTVRLQGVGLGLSGSPNKGTWFIAASSFPANAVHFKLGDGAQLDFGAQIANCRINCNDIAGSIGVRASTIQENSGMERVLVQSYTSVGIDMPDPGGGLFADNFLFEDCQCWCSSSATTSVGVYYGMAADHKNGAIRRMSIVPNGSPADQVAGVHITGGGGLYIDGLHVERHTDAVNLGAGTTATLVHVEGDISGTNVVNIATSRPVYAAGIRKTSGYSRTLTNSSVGHPNISVTDLALYASSGDRVIISQVATTGLGDVVTNTSNSASWVVRSMAVAGSNRRAWVDLVDGNGTGIRIRGSPDGTGVPLDLIAMNAGSAGTTFLTARSDTGALKTSGSYSMASAVGLPSAVSAQGYLYADSNSSLYWVNGSGVSSLIK